MKRKLALLAVMGLALVGCSAISSGTITAKNHRDAYQIPVTYCAGYNAKGICSFYGTRYDHYPERWSFDISDGDKNGWVNVSYQVWNEYEVGDYYGEKK